MKKLLTILVTFIFAALTQISTASAATIETDVNIDLDPKLYEFLKLFPADIQERLMTLMRASFDRADQSVFTAFNLLDQPIDQVGDIAYCTTNNMKVKELTSIFGGAPSIALKKDIQKIRKSFDWTTPPQEYIDAYVAVDHDAGLYRCRTDSKESGRGEIDTMRKDLKASTALWVRLNGVCSSSSECLAVTRATIEQKMSTSPPEDLKTVEALWRLRTIADPRKQNNGEYQNAAVEQSLMMLFDIGDDLRALTLKKANSEIKEYNELYKKINDQLVAVRNAQRTKPLPFLSEQCKAARAIKQATPKLDELANSLKKNAALNELEMQKMNTQNSEIITWGDFFGKAAIGIYNCSNF